MSFTVEQVLEEFVEAAGDVRVFYFGDGFRVFSPEQNARRARDSEKRNRMKVNARVRGDYARDPEKHKARVKAWKAANRERVNAAARRRAAKKRAS